jgi:hypothetical protein
MDCVTCQDRLAHSVESDPDPVGCCGAQNKRRVSPEGSRPSGCFLPPGPRPGVPDDPQQQGTLGDAQEPVVRRGFADRRRHDGDDVQARQDGCRPWRPRRSWSWHWTRWHLPGSPRVRASRADAHRRARRVRADPGEVAGEDLWLLAHTGRRAATLSVLVGRSRAGHHASPVPTGAASLRSRHRPHHGAGLSGNGSLVALLCVGTDALWQRRQPYLAVPPPRGRPATKRLRPGTGRCPGSPPRPPTTAQPGRSG